MKILALESSCDETAAAVVEAEGGRRFRVLSSIVASQIETHRLYGGVVPEIAGRAHIEAVSGITAEALQAAGLTPGELDLVAVTGHPGLIGALLVGVNFAKSLASSYRLPLVEVDHIRGHLAGAYLTDTPPTPPYLGLVVSGGHTALYYAESDAACRRIGGTRDDAMGESFDKVGRLIGIPYPAGAGFDALAAEGFRAACGTDPGAPIDYEAYARVAAGRDPALHLPDPALSDSLDFSFSGLKTAAVNLIHRYEQRGEELPRAAFAARYTYTAVQAVAAQLGRAMDLYPGCEPVVAGGVAANSHLRAVLSALCRRRGVRLHLLPPSLCGDNAAMIAAAGYYEYCAGHLATAALNASAADGDGM